MDRYPDMKIVKSISLFKFVGGVSGGTLATAEAELKGARTNRAKMAEYATTREAPYPSMNFEPWRWKRRLTR